MEALIVAAVLLVVGLVAGGTAERRHLRSLERREAELVRFLVTDVRSFDPRIDHSKTPAMVLGESVIATDYLKNVLAGLRNILGGEVKSYLTLVQRARREALLRMIERAREQGYDAICNLRLEAADIGANTSGRGVPMAAMIATGTAYALHRAPPPGSPPNR